MGQRVHIGPSYSAIPRESSAVSLSVPCWCVPCWSSLLASELTRKQMEYSLHPGTVWSPTLHSQTAPHLAAGNREWDRNGFNHISALRGGHTVLHCPVVAGQCLQIQSVSNVRFPQQHINKVPRAVVVDQHTETPQSEVLNTKDCLRKLRLRNKIASDSSDGVLHFMSN